MTEQRKRGSESTHSAAPLLQVADHQWLGPFLGRMGLLGSSKGSSKALSRLSAAAEPARTCLMGRGPTARAAPREWRNSLRDKGVQGASLLDGCLIGRPGEAPSEGPPRRVMAR